MLPVPENFITKCEHMLEQTCKRAMNTLDAMASKRYKISRKTGWFRKETFEVDVFSEYILDHGLDISIDNLFRLGKIDVMDYQLLKFFDNSRGFERFFEELKSRKTEDNTIPLTVDELCFANDIANFEEDPSITREEILERWL